LSTAPAPITFLSDYGLADEYVGVCHGVIARRCPAARVIDITHGIPPQDVRAGAIVLRGALPHMPVGVHLAVVDPGVGTPRAAVALRTEQEGRLLVGPDNGLLMLAAESLGGVAEAVDIGASPERLASRSATFHGRDVFAAVAAALAAGEALARVGEALDPAALVALRLPEACVVDGSIRAHVLHRDGFGNLILDAAPAQLREIGIGDGGGLTIDTAGSQRHRAKYASAFAEVNPGALLVYEDSLGMVAVAVNRGSAAEVLGAARDDELALAPA
jgi:S-adenosylmethionine hydrolase